MIAIRVIPLLVFLYVQSCVSPVPVAAQSGDRFDISDTLKPNYRLLHGIFAGQSLLYAGTLIGLSKSWYKNPLAHFSFKDDTPDWHQIDKAGHLFTSFQIARHTAQVYSVTGISKKQAVLYGAISGAMFQTPIELLDGFSPDYGFSPGDMVANFLGAGLFAFQHLYWDQVRIIPKFSFHQTPLAEVRPELLGRHLSERWLKDYNGQTYWLSTSPGLFARSSGWPDWLCLSFGYGINNMVSAQPALSQSMGFTPYREYYLSLDIDLTKIKSRHKFVRTLTFLLNSIKVPAPTLVASRTGIKFRPLYF